MLWQSCGPENKRVNGGEKGKRGKGEMAKTFRALPIAKSANVLYRKAGGFSLLPFSPFPHFSV